MGSDLDLQLETAREARMHHLDEVYAGQLGKWGKDQDANRHQQDMFSAGVKGAGHVFSWSTNATNGRWWWKRSGG